MRINILSLLLALCSLYGCTADENLVELPAVSSGAEQAQVVLSISVPEVSLPLSGTRAITDDKAIDNLAVWAFDADNKFLYQLTTEDTDDKGNLKVVKRGSTLYMLLPKSEEKVTLAIMANLDLETLRTPSANTTKQQALANLTYDYSLDMSYIPMYGESNAFVVEEGAKPGVIRLERALAKVEVSINNDLPDFLLEKVTVVHVNTKGTVVRLAGESITNLGDRNNFTTSASESENSWVGYIPEAAAINAEDTRVSLVLKGKKTGETDSRYYRLDFIKRAQSNGNVEYDYITTIERNKRYAFRIEYISSGGSTSLAEAVSKKEADNAITASTIMTIDDQAIRDITTDNQYYLGVTAPNITAEMNAEGDKKYYVANMSVITNNPEGWVIEDLSAGVNVSVKSFRPAPGGETEVATSVWVYIDREYSGSEVTLYVYSGRIRKSVRIAIRK